MSQRPIDLIEVDPAQLVPGTLVVCKYRIPAPTQPWMHEIYVGVIEEPGHNPAGWNGRNSEASYCAVTGTAKVRYEFGVQHDTRDSLVPLTPEQAALTPLEKVGLFLGSEARRCWERSSSRTSMLEEREGCEILDPVDVASSRTQGNQVY